ncbi:MAG: GNAT family N-acetyltransferase [Woeseiaceae bacterium]|nr:GNAT family N-acetyltransferase [Woeseiaceae bacterium]
MTINYLLRDVEDGDIEWLCGLNDESYRDVIIRQFGNWDEDFQRQWFNKKWDRNRPAKIVLVGSKPIGVIVLEQKDDHDWLDEILIKADYSGRGIGTSLIQDLIADARARNRRLRLRVLTENHDAKRLYERFGFEVLETLEQHYLMELDPAVTDR